MFAGGGSGGHVLPNVAVAECLDADIEPLFACSSRPVDASILEHEGLEHAALPVHPPSPRPMAALRFARGWRAATRWFSQAHSDRPIAVVLATGGFVTPPIAAAAAKRGVPVVLLSLDAVPGRANGLARRWADLELHGIRPSSDTDREPVGVPVRRAAISVDPASVCRTRLGLDPDRPTLLVTGASQGAATLDRLALDVATRPDRPLDGWQVLHLCRPSDRLNIESGWAGAGIPARVSSFVHAMGDAWGAADLAISRAGAGSVAEITGNRVPSVLFAYPWHRDRHQERNAAPLTDAGAAILSTDHIDAEANLADGGAKIASLLRDHGMRERIRRSLNDFPPAGAAAERVAEHVRAAIARS